MLRDPDGVEAELAGNGNDFHGFRVGLGLRFVAFEVSEKPEA
jgi:hypothetical protein